jgi:hypothetical protein
MGAQALAGAAEAHEHVLFNGNFSSSAGSTSSASAIFPMTSRPT